MLWPFSNIVEKSWIADAGLRAGVARRRFPPLWQIEETDACFIVRVSCEEEPGPTRRGQAAHRDEARQIAANMAKLPEACAQDLRGL